MIAKRFFFVVVLLALLVPPLGQMARADGAAVQSTLYFGLKSTDGVGVSEQAWARFLAEFITPRFPDGLTVLQAYGQSGDKSAKPNDVLAETTKMLIIVHPDAPEATKALAEIKAEYKKRFANTGVFHTDAPVHVAD